MLDFKTGILLILRNQNSLCPGKIRFNFRFAVFQKHFDDFLHIFSQLIKRFTLAVRSGKSRDITDIKSGFSAPFDYVIITFYNSD